jgi:hypothetical protein
LVVVEVVQRVVNSLNLQVASRQVQPVLLQHQCQHQAQELLLVRVALSLQHQRQQPRDLETRLYGSSWHKDYLVW